MYFTNNASHRSKESQEKRAARVSKIIQGKTPKNSRSRGREDSRSRGWGPHAPTDPPPVPPHGAYVAECLPEAYGGGGRKWWEEEGGGRKLWESGEISGGRWEVAGRLRMVGGSSSIARPRQSR